MCLDSVKSKMFLVVFRLAQETSVKTVSLVH